MEDNLSVCASAFIRNKGKTVFTENDFWMGMSMDLHWMPYTDSKAMLSAMIAAGLFEKNGDVVRATFAPGDVDIPVAYKPSQELIQSVRDGTAGKTSAAVASEPEKPDVPAEQNDVPKDIMPELMNIANEHGMGRKDFMLKCNALQKSLGIYIGVAGLYVLRDMGVDIGDLADRVYSIVTRM